MRWPVVLVVVSLCPEAWAAAAVKKPKPTPAAVNPAPAPEPEPVAAPAPAPAPAPTLAPAPAAEPPPAPAAAVPPSSAKPRLVVLALDSGGGIEPAVVSSLSEAVAAAAARTQLFEVTTQKDISTLLGLERQKQLLGCSDEAQSCLAELAGAIGARFVVSGSVTRLGDAYQLNLQTLDTVRTQTLGRSTRIASDLGRLQSLLPAAFAEASATPAPVPPSNVVPVVLMGAGAAAAVAAGVIFFQSYSREQSAVSELQLAKDQPTLQLKPASYYEGEANAVKQQRIISAAVLVGGVVLAGVGIALYRSPDSGTRVALVPSGNGAALVGVWP